MGELSCKKPWLSERFWTVLERNGLHGNIAVDTGFCFRELQILLGKGLLEEC